MDKELEAALFRRLICFDDWKHDSMGVTHTLTDSITGTRIIYEPQINSKFMFLDRLGEDDLRLCDTLVNLIKAELARIDSERLAEEHTSLRRKIYNNLGVEYDKT